MSLLQNLPQGSCTLTDELWALQCQSCQNYLLLGEFQAYVRKRKEKPRKRSFIYPFIECNVIDYQLCATCTLGKALERKP